jgi:hypothetical protein
MPLAEPDYSLVHAVRGVMNERNAAVAVLEILAAMTPAQRASGLAKNLIDEALAGLEKS